MGGGTAVLPAGKLRSGGGGLQPNPPGLPSQQHRTKEEVLVVGEDSKTANATGATGRGMGLEMTSARGCCSTELRKPRKVASGSLNRLWNLWRNSRTIREPRNDGVKSVLEQSEGYL